MFQFKKTSVGYETIFILSFMTTWAVVGDVIKENIGEK